MPGRHVTDHQMRLFMTHRSTDPVLVAAAKAGLGAAMGYRLELDPRPPSTKKAPRGWRRPDPLEGLFQEEAVPMLEAAPGLRPVAILGAAAPASRPWRWDPAHARAPDPHLAGAARARAGGDLPPAPRAGAARAAGLHRRGRARRDRRRHAAHTPALPLPPGLQRLRARPRPALDPDPGSCSAARASWRWPRASRTRCGASAAPPHGHRSDSLSAAFRSLDREVETD